MHDVIALAAALVNMMLFDAEIAQGKGHDLVQKIIVVPSQIDDLGVILCEPLHDKLEEAGVFAFPASGFLELPAVNDVAVEDKGIAGMGFKELHHFFHPRILDTQMQVRKYNGLVMFFHLRRFVKG
jgi:hypothetical protein